MAEYTKVFEKPYEEWENLPSEETPITANVLEMYDATFENLEDYLGDNSFITEYYLDETETMSTTTDTSFIFEDDAITEDSVIDVYTSIPCVNYTSISVTDGTCTVTYPKQESAVTMTCRIYLK